MSMFIVDGVRYRLWTPKDEEKEFHPIIKEHINEIFGQDAIYFDRGVQLRSLAGLGAKPEGFVIDLKKNEWSIVEVELSKHDAYSHIVDQLTRFINGIDNPQTRSTIVEAIYDEICKNKVLKAVVEEKVKGDVHHWLTRLINTSPKIVVVIEEKTQKVIEACKLLMRNFETYIIEFKTYTREDAQNVHAHLFEPLYGIKRIEVKEKEEKERRVPEHYKDWQSLFNWVEDNVKDVTKALESSIISINPSEVTKAVHGRYLCFYKGKPSTKSTFVAFLLTKKALKVRIRTDPNTFKDPQKLTGDKVYKGWFFKQGQEREFKITSKEQISYAMELIKQSYDISGEH